MGLTVHYSLTAKDVDPVATVNAIRAIALEFPFDGVSKVTQVTGDFCDPQMHARNQALSWMLIQGQTSVTCPWNKRRSRRISPTSLVAFTIDVGPGCEPANIGLCEYPAAIDWEYSVEDDAKFQTLRPGDFIYRFNHERWSAYCYRHKLPVSMLIDRPVRQVPTKIKGLQWRSFCKTGYAVSEDAGGVRNFLKCHIGLVTFLERVSKLPGIKLTIDDEGQYGPATYSDDWQEASSTGREPTYRRHPGTYNPQELLKQVGQSNELQAALAGVFSDNGIAVDAPIKSFQNFEQLEFRGRQRKHVMLFLNAIAQACRETAVAAGS